MAKGTAFSTELLELILNGVAIAGLAQNHSAPVSLDVALHTALPGVGNPQTTNELSFGGYGRMTIARDGAQWTVVAGSATNDNAVTAPAESTGPTQTAAAFSVGLVGGNTVIYEGAISPTYEITSGTTPAFAAGDLTITEA